MSDLVKEQMVGKNEINPPVDFLRNTWGRGVWNMRWVCFAVLKWPVSDRGGHHIPRPEQDT